MYGDTERSQLETLELRRRELKDRISIKYTETEEGLLLAAMEAAGIAWEEGAAPYRRALMPFAATVMHLFGEHRTQRGIVSKIQFLLRSGPRANKSYRCGAGSGVEGLVGVCVRKENRSQPRSLPPTPRCIAACAAGLRRCRPPSLRRVSSLARRASGIGL